MKKNELRVWALRTHLPDEWWVEVDGEVHESILNLDDAFRMAENAGEAYIIHASHAEENDDPHWMPVGAEEEREDPFGIPKWVCAKCRFCFEKPILKRPPVSVVEVVGYLLIVPGLVMTLVRMSSTKPTCPHCGSRSLVVGTTKAGQALLSR